MLQAIGSLVASGEGQSTTGTGGVSLLGSLYAYYKLDEASGNAIDSSGNGRTLPNQSNPITSTTGIITSARLWASGGSAYFFSAANTFQPGTSHFSFSLWVNLTNTAQSGGDTGLLSKTSTSAGAREYILWYKPPDLKFHFYISPDGTAASEVISAISPAAGTWYHLTGGWDGTNIWLSVNATTRITAAFSGPVFQSNSGFQIGFESGSSAPLAGAIDEFGFWIGRDLTDQEIATLYNGGSGLPFSSF